MLVLIIDPSRSYAALIANLLSSDNAKSEIRHTGTDALAYIAENCPDAICISHELPDMNSHTFIQQLRQQHLCTNTPKFLLTSSTSEEFRRKSYDAGFTEVFQKANISILQRTLHSILLFTSSYIQAKILYVEDVPSTAAYTMSIMQQAGWEVTYASTGEAAIEFFEANEYDLVITDLILDGEISGLHFINFIRNHRSESKSNTPIMAISGWNDLLRQVYVLRHGASDFVSKPFQENDFLARAVNLIHNKRTLDASVSERKALYNKANTDQLTGLANRHHYNEYADKIVRRIFARGDHLSAMLIDLDHFKVVNDKYGHKSGDEVLAKVGAVLKMYCRADDLAIRFGGEEFMLILPQCHATHALKKAEEIRQYIEQLRPAGIDVTVSIGVSSIDYERIQSLSALYEDADKALYLAKSSGRNQIASTSKNTIKL